MTLSGGTFWFGTQSERIAGGKLMASNPKDGADSAKIVEKMSIEMMVMTMIIGVMIYS